MEAAIKGLDLPGSRRRHSGSYLAGRRRPDEMPVTQWLNDRVPVIEPAGWTLSVATDAGDAARFGLQDLDAIGEEVTAVLDCTGGWYAEQVWHGVRLDRLLSASGGSPEPGVRSIRVVSATGYSRRFPIDDRARIWLATRVGGGALSPGHGFPARIVAPGRRGFWWVKWVELVQLDATPWWWQPPYPLT
jgi:DMSO/TMAO reductase YedYZ molybdopterin-dependent catalytic subunit